MLVLTRKAGEQVLIADDIIVKVISIEKDIVRIGIEAPKNVKVLRYELIQEVKNENVEALQGKERLMKIKDLKGLIKDNEWWDCIGRFMEYWFYKPAFLILWVYRLLHLSLDAGSITKKYKVQFIFIS